MHSDFTLRGADEFDAEFLELMLVAAYNWNPQKQQPAEHWRAQPEFAKYLDGWKRHDDYGFVVEVDSEPIGAVWMRRFSAEAPGYGYVDDDTPELSMAVLDGFRGRGVGRVLLQAAIDASDDGVSLSVEDGNRARALYEAHGFVAVGRVGGSTTMLWRPTNKS